MSPSPSLSPVPTRSPSTSFPTRSPTPNVTHGELPEGDVAPLIIFTVILLLGSVYATHKLLHHFARADTPLGLKSIVGLSWFMGIAGVLVLLPADLVSAYFGAGRVYMEVLWDIVYWVTFMLAWVISPIAQQYHLTGHFTFASRMKEAILNNIKFYLAIGVVLLVLGGALWLAGALQISFVFALVNFYGMFLIVVMLGYGLVEVPTGIWRAADVHHALESHEFRAGAVETAMIDAEDCVEEAVDAVVEFRQRVSQKGDMELLARCDQVLQKAPRRAMAPPGARRGAVDGGGTSPLTLNHLAYLHMKLKRSLVAAERARWDFDYLLEKTAYLERILQDQARTGTLDQEGIGSRDLELAGGAGVGVGVGGAGGHAAVIQPARTEDEEEVVVSPSSPSLRKRLMRTLRYYNDQCQVRYYKYVYRGLSVLAMICSLVLLWSCVISPFDPALSVFGLAIANVHTPVLIFLLSFFPLLYMAICLYTALFKFRYLDALQLHGNRQTDAYNLLYNAGYMGRLQFSLGVVYFQMLDEQDSQNTAFHLLVGDMDTVPLLGESFNTYSSFFIIVFSLASFFSAGDRMLDWMGISTHRRPRRGNREHEERIEEGRRLILTARTRRDRERMRTSTPRAGGVSGVGGQTNQQQQGANTGFGGQYTSVTDLFQRI